MPAVQLANTFVGRFSQDNYIDHLKLQKLSYFCYGWWLAIRDQSPPLVNVKPQVWKQGPVFYPIYAAFAHFRGSRIDRMQAAVPLRPAEFLSSDDSPESQFVDWIWMRYGNFSGIELSSMTHQPGTPWYQIAEEHHFNVPRFYEMSDDANRAYFRHLAKEEGFIS